MTRLPKVLAIDDDRYWLSQIPLILEDTFEVSTRTTIDQGINAIQEDFYDAVLLDMNFGDDARTGIDVFRTIKAKDPKADIIVISGETRPDKIIQIMNAGVTSFLPKPCTPDQIRSAISNAIHAKRMKQRALNTGLGSSLEDLLIGGSPQMKKVREDVIHVATSRTKDVLLMGENGTGKEEVAKAIAYVADPKSLFIPVLCSAISEGLAESELFGHVKGAFTGADRDRPSVFEEVGSGFVMFDEIGDMPMPQQAKLLRVMQERKLHRVGSYKSIELGFRSISATNVDLLRAVAEKRFREDLYYRIAKEIITIPPLRERREDIIDLIYHFLAMCFPQNDLTITDDAIQLLMAYHWPGNVRQLKAMIESIGSRNTSGVIRESDICQAIPQIASVFGNKASKALIGRYGASLINQERDRIERAIKSSESVEEAAAKVNLTRSTFYRRAKDLGLIKERKKKVVPAYQ